MLLLVPPNQLQNPGGIVGPSLQRPGGTLQAITSQTTSPPNNHPTAGDTTNVLCGGSGISSSSFGLSVNDLVSGPNTIACGCPSTVPQNVIDQLLASYTIPTAAVPSIPFVSEPLSLPVPIQLRPNYMASSNNARCGYIHFCFLCPFSINYVSSTEYPLGTYIDLHCHRRILMSLLNRSFARSPKFAKRLSAKNTGID